MEKKSLSQTGLIHKGKEKIREEGTASLGLSVELVVLSSQADYLTALGSTPLLAFPGSNMMDLHYHVCHGIVCNLKTPNTLSRGWGDGCVAKSPCWIILRMGLRSQIPCSMAHVPCIRVTRSLREIRLGGSLGLGGFQNSQDNMSHGFRERLSPGNR